MTLLDAKEYHPERERRKRTRIVSAIVVILAIGGAAWLNRFWPENEFLQDWGPGGQWGLVKSYKIFGASNCPGGGSGVVVDLIVNDRAQHAQLYVDKSDKTISSPPCDLEFR
jgi:hypothetical protein